ncbi:MAG: YtxH domain-containing protein [Chloroflexota bacterium]|nr:YtxH domain-containing protein [Chloroflexota bacterium]
MASWRERVLDRRERVLDRAEEARLRAATERDLEALKREDEAESSGFFGGFGLGLLVGAVLALVFAPQTGEETRGMVAERAVQLKERASDLVSQVRGDDESTADVAPAIEREIDDAAGAPS